MEGCGGYRGLCVGVGWGGGGCQSSSPCGSQRIDLKIIIF